MITIISDTEADYLYNGNLYRISIREPVDNTSRDITKEIYLNNAWVSGVTGILTIEELAHRIYNRDINYNTLPTTVVIYHFCRNYIGERYPELLL